MEIHDLESLIARTGDLPTMPAIAVKVMELVGDPATSATDLQDVISHDQALTTKVLKIANSAMFGVSRDISTLSHAIMILGFSTIRSIVLATSTKSIYMKIPSVGVFTAKLLWDHSLGVAMFSRRIAQDLKTINEEEAFVAGLLHDIGKTVINFSFADKYEDVIKAVYNEGLEFRDSEFRFLGFAHTQVGSLVLRKWNLTRSLEDAVLNHHTPEESEGHETLTAVVSFANEVSKKMGIGPIHKENIDLMGTDAAKILGYTGGTITRVEQQLQKDFEANRELFEL